MSWDTIHWAKEVTVVKGGTKAILVMLAIHVNEEGTAWPSHKSLARYCGLSIRTIQAGIRELKAKGLITVSRKANQYSLTHYQLNGHPQNTVSTAPADFSLSTRKLRPEHPQITDSAPANFSDGNTKEPQRKLMKAKPPHPEWFEPLKLLEGYRDGHHKRAIDAIRAGCESYEVEPPAVISAFCLYYPIGRVRHGWTTPVAALARNIDLQCQKALKAQSRNGHDPPQRRAARNEAPTNRGDYKTPWDR